MYASSSSYNSNSPPQDSFDAPNSSHPVSHSLADFQHRDAAIRFLNMAKVTTVYVSSELRYRLRVKIIAQQQCTS